MKRWVRCDLPKETAGRFREYCRDMHITHETSENGNCIHFECYMSAHEMEMANAFIEARC